MNEHTQRRQRWRKKRIAREGETRLLEWPPEGARQGLYRSMMIFEHGIPGREFDEDPGWLGGGRGKVPRGLETVGKASPW
jgi:hypothetical protein